jgi:Icc-related predicted phosphoesterase
MKILAIGDLHGRKPKIRTKDFDAIIFVGDVGDDSEIGPLYKEYFKLLKDKRDELPDFDNWAPSRVGGKKKYKEMEKRSLKKGRKILEYLNSFNKPIFMVPGNWDQSYGKTKVKDMNKNRYNYLKSFLDYWLGEKINPILVKGLKNIKNCQFKTHKFNGFNIIGYGLSSNKEYLPKNTKKSRKGKLKPEEIIKLKKGYYKLVSKLDLAYGKGDRNVSTIFISHNTPYKTKLDLIKNRKSYAYKKHLGSSVARQFCVRHKPLLCICGHIHEGMGKDKIGKTMLINPGFGEKAQVLIQIDEEKRKVKIVRFLKN